MSERSSIAVSRTNRERLSKIARWGESLDNALARVLDVYEATVQQAIKDANKEKKVRA